jgi:hypothetical protein
MKHAATGLGHDHKNNIFLCDINELICYIFHNKSHFRLAAPARKAGWRGLTPHAMGLSLPSRTCPRGVQRSGAEIGRATGC